MSSCALFPSLVRHTLKFTSCSVSEIILCCRCAVAFTFFFTLPISSFIGREEEAEGITQGPGDKHHASLNYPSLSLMLPEAFKTWAPCYLEARIPAHRHFSLSISLLLFFAHRCAECPRSDSPHFACVPI